MMLVPANKVFCGDNVGILRKKIPDACIDLVVTSPPYDELREYEGYEWNFEALAKELTRVLKPGGVIVWVVADATVDGSETLTSFKQAIYFKDVCGLNVNDTMIWKKDGFTAVGALAVRYAPVFEYMFVLTKGKPKTFNPIKDKRNKIQTGTIGGTIRQKDGTFKRMSGAGKKKYQKFGQRTNIWHMNPNQQQSSHHPAAFPLALARDHIISWSNENDLVLDPFLGSGTTCVAAKHLKRRYVGIEISKKYCDAAKKRIDKALPFLVY